MHTHTNITDNHYHKKAMHTNKRATAGLTVYSGSNTCMVEVQVIFIAIMTYYVADI